MIQNQRKLTEPNRTEPIHKGTKIENRKFNRKITNRQALRLTEDVDIQSDGAGGYYVGWNAESEFLIYTVEVTEDGERD